jgi:hypothetical protein
VQQGNHPGKASVILLPTLFTSAALPKAANKPKLANAIWNKVNGVSQTGPTGEVLYVVDRGALLQSYGIVVRHMKLLSTAMLTM